MKDLLEKSYKQIIFSFKPYRYLQHTLSGGIYRIPQDFSFTLCFSKSFPVYSKALQPFLLRLSYRAVFKLNFLFCIIASSLSVLFGIRQNSQDKTLIRRSYIYKKGLFIYLTDHKKLTEKNNKAVSR